MKRTPHVRSIASQRGGESKERGWFRKPAMLWLYRAMAALLLLTAGYLTTYQLFFLSLPLEDYAANVVGGQPEAFRYDGVVYFNGTRLSGGDKVVMDYGSARVLDWAGDKGIELFVRVDDLPEGASPADIIGTLRVESRVGDVVMVSTDVPLQGVKLQRHMAPWKTEAGAPNEFSIQFNKANDRPEPGYVVVSTNIVNVRYWLAILLLAILGAAAVFMLSYAQRFGNLRLLAVIGVSTAVMVVLHSGAFISNEFFEAPEDSIWGIYDRAWKFLSQGIWTPGEYRGTGYMLIPAATFLIEGLEASKDGQFMLSTLPTPRYLMFAWFAVSLPLLIRAIHTHIHRGVAFIFGVLAASFFPFIIDLYNICDDAYAIPLYTVFLAAFITRAYGRTALRRSGPSTSSTSVHRWEWGPLIVMAATFLMMMTVKVTAAYLLVLAPLGLWVQGMHERKKLFQAGPAALLVLMIGALLGGRAFAGVGERYVQPGYPWARGAMMEIIWAANGLYDEHSAFWFAKHGTTRTQRVVEQTGLPNTSKIRHSQAATNLVYSPQVLNALRQRPGFFWANAVLRTYNDGLGFFRYRYGGSDRWEKWMEDGLGKQVVISGEKVRILKHERRLIRFGKMWKVSLLVLWTKLIQGQLSMGVDIALMLGAALGIVLLRRWDMGILLLGCFAAKIIFNNVIHGLVRYMDFNHVGLLIGLSAALWCIWVGLKLAARRSFWRHAVAQPSCRRSRT